MKRKANFIFMWIAILVALSAWIPILAADHYLKMAAVEMLAPGITEGWVLVIRGSLGDTMFFYGFDSAGKFHRVLVKRERGEGRRR